MIYALIFENEVKNRFECENYELANRLARASFGGDAFAIDASNYATIIGDRYENGRFYRSVEGDALEEVKYIPTEREKIDDLQNKLIQSQLVLTDTYEEKLELENKLMAMQQAIEKIYEKIGG